MAARLKDIAEHAGVSTALVSNYLNRRNCARMSEVTRERIDAALRELDYRPSDTARSLRTGRSRMIGILVGALQNEIRQIEMMMLCDAFSVHGYHTVSFYTRNEPELFLEGLRQLQQRGCDGLVISGNTHLPNIAETIGKYAVPAILLGSHRADELPGQTIRYDFGVGVHEAIDYLVSLGHRNIGMVARSWGWLRQDQRYLAFAERLGQDKVECVDSLEEINRDFLENLLEKHPDRTAFIGSNDMVAMRLIQSAAELGLSVPGDFSVIGFDDISAAGCANPALTSIRQPVEPAVGAAVALMLHLLDGSPAPAERNMNTILKIRSSCGPVRQHTIFYQKG